MNLEAEPKATEDPLLQRRRYSLKPKAIAERSRTLTDGAHHLELERRQRERNRQQGLKVIKNSRWLASQRKGGLANRVREHLARGRDAADIVVRERLPASVVVRLIEQVQSEAATAGQGQP